MKADISITNAEMLAIDATPIALLPPPGAGFCYNIIRATLYWKNFVANYNSIGAGSELRLAPTGSNAPYTDNVLEATANQVTAFLAGGTRRIAQLGTHQQTPVGITEAISAFDLNEIAEQNVELQLGNNGGPLGGGNAGNVLGVQILYEIIPLT